MSVNTSTRPSIRTAASLTLVCGLHSIASACLHVPEAYEGSFQSQSQQSIVHHDGTNETLIVKMDPPGVPAGAAPSGGIPMAAIIPVPVAPDQVKLDVLHLVTGSDKDNMAACQKLFEDLKRFVDHHAEKPSKSLDWDKSEAGAVQTFVEVVVGPYGITRFDNTEAGRKALGEWIVARSLEASPGTEQKEPIRPLDFGLPAFKSYLEGTWTFCALRVVDTSQSFAPLKIEFPSSSFFFPIKLTAAGSEPSLDREGTYTAYAFTPAGHDVTRITESMALHLLSKAEGQYEFADAANSQDRQVPIKLSPEELKQYEALPLLLTALGTTAEKVQLMRYQGKFAGRQALHFEGDVAVPMK